MDIPQCLYKYRAFNVHSLRLLSQAEVHYSDPNDFNDPLDCNPTIEIDTDRATLEKLCIELLKRSKTCKAAHERIDLHRYMSTEYGDYNSDPAVEKYYLQFLASDVKQSLLDEFGKMGVFSMASSWDCPLMWSHYADNHHGICIEYDSADAEFKNLAVVGYDRPRSIKISEVIAWKLHGCVRSKASVFDTFFLSKAPQWEYEAEWRDVSNCQGVQQAPVQIKSIHFGLRCDSSVRTSVVKLLSKMSIAFYDIYPKDESFQLARREVDTDEIEACGVRSSALFDFRDVVFDEPNDT